jgi:hypothetical protein
MQTRGNPVGDRWQNVFIYVSMYVFHSTINSPRRELIITYLYVDYTVMHAIAYQWPYMDSMCIKRPIHSLHPLVGSVRASGKKLCLSAMPKSGGLEKGPKSVGKEKSSKSAGKKPKGADKEKKDKKDKKDKKEKKEKKEKKKETRASSSKAFPAEDKVEGVQLTRKTFSDVPGKDLVESILSHAKVRVNASAPPLPWESHCAGQGGVSYAMKYMGVMHSCQFASECSPYPAAYHIANHDVSHLISSIEYMLADEGH